MSSRKQVSKSAKKARREKQLRDIFLWLLGMNGDFPQSEPGRRYGFRSELGQRLERIGFQLIPAGTLDSATTSSPKAKGKDADAGANSRRKAPASAKSKKQSKEK